MIFGFPGETEEDTREIIEFFQANRNISPQQSEEIDAAFVDSLPDKPNPQFYVHEVYQFLYACSFPDDKTLPTMLR